MDTPSRYELGQVDILSDGWLVGQLQLAGWPSNKMSTVFCMKGLCEARSKPLSVLKNEMTFLYLGRWTPKMRLRVKLTFGQMDPQDET